MVALCVTEVFPTAVWQTSTGSEVQVYKKDEGIDWSLCGWPELQHSPACVCFVCVDQISKWQLQAAAQCQFTITRWEGWLPSHTNRKCLLTVNPGSLEKRACGDISANEMPHSNWNVQWVEFKACSILSKTIWQRFMVLVAVHIVPVRKWNLRWVVLKD